MSDAPSFPFYANDFVGGRVATYNLDEIGAYSLLLAYDWTLNGLPICSENESKTSRESRENVAKITRESRKTLARLLRVSLRKADVLWAKIGDQFVERDGRMYNPRLALERAKKGIKSASGRDAAAMRWQSGRNADASIPHAIPHGQNDATTTSTSSLPSKQVEVVSTARENSEAISPHIRLVVAANKGLAEHPVKPQPIARIFAGQAGSLQAADTILEAGVPLAFAESRIYGLAKTHSADGEVKSLRYFAAATIRAWQEHLARSDADKAVIESPPSNGQPNGARRATAPIGPGERTYLAAKAALEGL
jgi:uncharacterized protein YdaU (DUF1376 family)